jgi:molecular chaperone DnaK (HSP70)
MDTAHIGIDLGTTVIVVAEMKDDKPDSSLIQHMTIARTAWYLRLPLRHVPERKMVCPKDAK